jgi:hypothetical protein
MSLVPNTDIENVRRLGGMTFDNQRLPIQPEAGYFVATYNIISGWYSLDDIWQELEYHYWPNEYQYDYLGFWQDPDSLYWYVDFVIHTYSLSHAMRIAKDRRELAIYDCANGASINVE